MHYAFDEWLRRYFADVQFARYADEAVVHASSLAEAEKLLTAIRSRLAEYGPELHPKKTKIVYCQDGDRRSMNILPLIYLDTRFVLVAPRTAGESCSSAFYPV